MSDTEQGIEAWIGHDAVGNDDSKIGTIEEIYLDDATGQPEWLAIKTGMFGTKQSFAPIQGAEADGDVLRLPFSKDQVKDAPKVDPDGHLEPDEEDALYRHYGRDTGTDGQTTVDRTEGQRTDTQDRAAADAGDDATMTRSEEELRVGTRSREAGKVRLRKYVVTENVTKTVPVRREEVRIEREPITEGDRTGGDLSEDEQEMTLHEEEVVVDKDVVGKEKVRLEKDVTTEDREVSEQVRKERIETDQGDVDTKGDRK